MVAEHDRCEAGWPVAGDAAFLAFVRSVSRCREVVPLLNIDGQLVKQGSAVSLGAKQKAIARILYPSLSTMSDFRFVKELDAGSYYAIGILNGVPTKQFLEGKQALLEDVKSRLESASGAVKDESLGEMLHTTVTGYIAQTEVEARLSATSSRVFYHGLPSISFTHTYLVRNNLFGIVKSVSMSDLIMDVQARNVTLALDGDREKTKLYAQQNGVMGSYYEGHIWKQMFPDDPGINPVSTVHLFAQAAIQGQPFVVIDRSNMNKALANITGLGDDTRADIVNSVLAGNTVTTHSMPINMGDWRGFGYVVFNPQTFSSVYMIDGGPRGGCTGCGDSDDAEQAYNSFIDTAKYAGVLGICEELLDDIVKLIVSVLSELHEVPFLGKLVDAIDFVMKYKEYRETMQPEEALALLYLHMNVIMLGLSYIMPYIIVATPPGANALAAALWVTIWASLYVMLIDALMDTIINASHANMLNIDVYIKRNNIMGKFTLYVVAHSKVLPIVYKLKHNQSRDRININIQRINNMTLGEMTHCII